MTILLGGTAYPALTVSVYFGWFQHNRQCRAVATYFLSKSKKSFIGPQWVYRGSKEYFWMAHYQLYRVIFAIQWLMKVRFLGSPSVNDCQTLSGQFSWKSILEDMRSFHARSISIMCRSGLELSFRFCHRKLLVEFTHEVIEGVRLSSPVPLTIKRVPSIVL